MQRSKCHPHRKFTRTEDDLLVDLVQNVSVTDWAFIASHMPGRNPRQCRERWLNYLSPEIKSTPWTAEEERILEEKVSELGTEWHLICPFLPNRPKNQIRHQWVRKCRRVCAQSIIATIGNEHDSLAPAPSKDRPRNCQDQTETPGDLFKFEEENCDIFAHCRPIPFSF
jgi:hypothetical protein